MFGPGRYTLVHGLHRDAPFADFTGDGVYVLIHDRSSFDTLELRTSELRPFLTVTGNNELDFIVLFVEDIGNLRIRVTDQFSTYEALNANGIDMADWLGLARDIAARTGVIVDDECEIYREGNREEVAFLLQSVTSAVHDISGALFMAFRPPKEAWELLSTMPGEEEEERL